ncbi:MAG: efflux transporter outer membrane subunit [Acetobacteraceae bacterium]
MKGRCVMRRAYHKLALLPAMALILTSGCVGPKFHRPKPWTPNQYRMPEREGEAGVTSRTTQDPAEANWWGLFNDPELSSLQSRLASQNLDIQRATTQLAQSRAQLMIAGAGRYPSLSAMGSYQRSQYITKFFQRALSQIGQNCRDSLGAQNATLLDQSIGNVVVPQLNQWQTGIDAQYELDLLGRVARQYESAKAMLQATDEQRRSVIIAQQADLAYDYLALRGLQEQLRILKENRATAQRTLDLARERQHVGLVTELDVKSAQRQLDTTTAQIAQMKQHVTQQINAINLLLGLPPGSLDDELQRTAGIPVVPPRVPVGLPSDLVRRRPDIRQAEAQLHAAVANIAEAEAEFYPKVTISADFGLQTLSFRDLGFWNARAWNVGPSISLPIFQGGRLRGNLMLTKYAEQTAAITYRQTVLGAWRDVDNALVAYRDEQKRHQGLVSASAAARRALDLAKDQYRSGLVTYLDVLSAQQALLDAEMQVADSSMTVAANLTRLYNALGGGWENIAPEEAAKSALTSKTYDKLTSR